MRLRNFPLVTDHWSLVTEVTFPYRSAVFTVCNITCTGCPWNVVGGVSIPLGSLHSLQRKKADPINLVLEKGFHTARQSSQSATLALESRFHYMPRRRFPLIPLTSAPSPTIRASSKAEILANSADSMRFSEISANPPPFCTMRRLAVVYTALKPCLSNPV